MATKTNEKANEVEKNEFSVDAETGEVTGNPFVDEVEDLDEVEDITEEKVYIDTGLTVYRKKYRKDGKEYFSYHSSSKTRRGEVMVNWIPSDVGGYDQLDMVFFEKKEMPLYKSPYSIKDEKGKVTNGFSYFVRDYDEEEKLWFEAKIKPSKSSDKGNLDTLLIKAER